MNVESKKDLSYLKGVQIFIIPKSKFELMAKEVAQTYEYFNLNFQEDALNTLQKFAEAYMVDFCKDIKINADQHGHNIIQLTDLEEIYEQRKNEFNVKENPKHKTKKPNSGVLGNYISEDNFNKEMFLIFFRSGGYEGKVRPSVYGWGIGRRLSGWLPGKGLLLVFSNFLEKIIKRAIINMEKDNRTTIIESDIMY